MRQLGSITSKALMAGTVAGVMAFGAAGQAQAGAKAFSALTVAAFMVTDTNDTKPEFLSPSAGRNFNATRFLTRNSIRVGQKNP